MRAQPVTFHLYAESDAEVLELQRALYDLVMALYSEGVLLTASKVSGLLARFANSPYLKQFLK